MFYLVLYISKVAYLLIRIFKIGAGYTWPGHLALKIYPSLFKSNHINFSKGLIYVSGTNGKTTTTKLLTHIFSRNNVRVLHNKSGANLLNGIASAILLERDWLGRSSSDLAIFEVDELTLPYLVERIPPTVLVLLNLSRDQLDRYGEIDTILARWETSFKLLTSSTTLVLDSTQRKFNVIADVFPGKTFYFNDDLENIHYTKLVGDFNAKNVNAAITVAGILGVDVAKSLASLADFDAAYGRGEILEHSDRIYHLFLAKNPTSFNNNMDLLLANELLPDTLLFILNDDPRDGRDVSWIYDIDRKHLAQACEGRELFVAGTRCLDMAVRIQYAGLTVKPDNVSLNLRNIIEKIGKTPHTKTVAVFPNYSAMLEFRELLLGRQIL